MSERGYIRFYRSIFTHPVFKPEPFTEREAWTWLITKAAWKPIQQRLGEHLIDLDRGETVGAVRYLADEWQWSKGKVERYLERLKKQGMLDTKTGTGITIIEVCNYSIFQGGDDDTGTEAGRQPGRGRDEAGTAPGQRRDGGGDNRKKLNTLKELKEGEEGKETISGAEAPSLFGTDLVPVAQAVPLKPKRKVAKPVWTPELQAGFDRFWAECPVKNAKDRARTHFLEVVTSGKATVDLLVERMVEFRGIEEAKYTSGRYREPWQFTTEPPNWLRDGHYSNQKAPIAGAQAGPAMAGRASSAIEGIMSRITTEEPHDG